MKTFTLICLCSMALAAGSFAQSPASSAVNATATTPSVSPTASTSPESEIEKSIRSKHKKHFRISIGDHDITNDDSDSDDRPTDKDLEKILPIVAISLLAVFGTPILIVALIMYFGFSKSRARHRTIRMMVEKGQPVPPELLAPPPPAVRQRSDMRRGVVMVMIGTGLMVFLGAVNDWDGGAWAVGIIPFLIGVGYLLVWKLEGGGKAKADNPPPLP